MGNSNYEKCNGCGVPKYIHGTACGWANANYIIHPSNEAEREYKRLKEGAMNYYIDGISREPVTIPFSPMTTNQLKEIAPEWVVANGIIRPVNKETFLDYHLRSVYTAYTAKEAFDENQHCYERERYCQQHALATDLPDGTYSAEGLKVVWEVRNRIGNRGMYDNTNLSEFKSVSKEYYDHFVTFGDAELHRIKITK